MRKPTRKEATLDAAAGAAQEERDWKARRDELIIKAYLDGWSYREIGAAVGMSHMGPAEIIQKSGVRRAEKV